MVPSDVRLHALRGPAVVGLLRGHLRGGVREAGRAGHLAGLVRLVVRVHLLVGGGLDVAGEGTAVSGGQVAGAAVDGVGRVDAGGLRLLLGRLLGRLLLLVGRAARRGGGVAVGEVVDPRLGAVLAVDGAGGGQLGRGVDGPGVGHVLGEAAASGDVAVVVAADVVVAVGGILLGGWRLLDWRALCQYV